MSRPVAAMNAPNSVTVIVFVDMANGLPIVTQRGEDGGIAASRPVPFAPCLNRPAGSTVSTGQVGQSRMTVPGMGAGADESAAAFSGPCAGNGCAVAQEPGGHRESRNRNHTGSPSDRTGSTSSNRFGSQRRGGRVPARIGR